MSDQPDGEIRIGEVDGITVTSRTEGKVTKITAVDERFGERVKRMVDALRREKTKRIERLGTDPPDFVYLR